MSIVKLKNGKEKFINDEIDLRYLISEELGSDAEDEYIKIIEKIKLSTKIVTILEADKKELKEENSQLEKDNSKLQKEIYELQESLDCVKEILKSLREEYNYNENENRKILNVIKSLENNIEI